MFSLWRDGCVEGRRLGSFENCLSARLSRNKDAGLAEPWRVSPNTLDYPRQLPFAYFGSCLLSSHSIVMAALNYRPLLKDLGWGPVQSCLPSLGYSRQERASEGRGGAVLPICLTKTHKGLISSSHKQDVACRAAPRPNRPRWGSD